MNDQLLSNRIIQQILFFLITMPNKNAFLTLLIHLCTITRSQHGISNATKNLLGTSIGIAVPPSFISSHIMHCLHWRDVEKVNRCSNCFSSKIIRKLLLIQHTPYHLYYCSILFFNDSILFQCSSHSSYLLIQFCLQNKVNSSDKISPPPSVQRIFNQ